MPALPLFGVMKKSYFYLSVWLSLHTNPLLELASMAHTYTTVSLVGGVIELVFGHTLNK